jgi:hypothetical protein
MSSQFSIFLFIIIFIYGYKDPTCNIFKYWLRQLIWTGGVVQF